MTSRTTLLTRAAVALTSAGVVLAGVVVLTGVSADASITKARTPFAYQGSAFGTRVTAGNPNQGGVASGRTAWSILACTDMAPIEHDKTANVGTVNANDYVQVGAVDSLTSSYRYPARHVFGSRSLNKVANVVLGADTGPQLTIDAVTTTANAFNKSGTYGARAGVHLAGVNLTGDPTGGSTPTQLQQLEDAINQGSGAAVEQVIASSGSGIDIPGLGTVYPAGTQKKYVGHTVAAASAFGIRVVLDNGSEVTIGRAWAKIQKASPAGVFSGSAYGYEAVVADGVAGLGRTPYQGLPCPGTKGVWLANSLAEAPQNAQLNATGLRAATYGRPNSDGSAVARARASVADLKLEGGALDIQGVVGQVNVFQNKSGKVVRRTLEGTGVGAIVANGQTQTIPAPGETLEIPGVAKITVGVGQQLGTRGLLVHALRVELLDGSGLVLNVGTAKARISR